MGVESSFSPQCLLQQGCTSLVQLCFRLLLRPARQTYSGSRAEGFVPGLQSRAQRRRRQGQWRQAPVSTFCTLNQQLQCCYRRFVTCPRSKPYHKVAEMLFFPSLRGLHVSKLHGCCKVSESCPHLELQHAATQLDVAQKSGSVLRNNKTCFCRRFLQIFETSPKEFGKKHAPFLGRKNALLVKLKKIIKKKQKNRLRSWDKLARLLGKNGSVFFGKKHAPFRKNCSDFGKNWFRFEGKCSIWGGGGNWFGFWSLTVLNAKHVWAWVIEV